MKKVLLVEDDMMNEKLFVFLLDREGCEVLHRQDGSNLMQYIHEFQPDVILMDINLPGMNGEELCKMIRNDHHMTDVKIIALTAYAMKGDAERFLMNGFNGYISKPIKAMQFVEEVKKIISA